LFPLQRVQQALRINLELLGFSARRHCRREIQNLTR
jgi:hypothetical protein